MASSPRAAEMAKIISLDWDSEVESAASFVVRRFPDDKVDDLAAAVEIMAELALADDNVVDEDKEELAGWIEARRAERKK